MAPYISVINNNLEEDTKMDEVLKGIKEGLIAGEIRKVEGLVEKALANGIPAKQILDDGLVAGMDVVGQRFKADEMFIPEVLLCAKVMHAGMEILKPALIEGGDQSIGTFVIGTVQGDLHDIGKNLVKMMLQGAGFKVVDLGIDTKPQAFVEAIKEHGADIVGMSALLTTTMPMMGVTINAIKEAGLRDQVKVMVGGAPVTASFAEKVGADAFGSNAASAVDMAKQLLKE